MRFFLFLLAWSASHLTIFAETVCSDIKQPDHLATVSVWVKHFPNTSIFRISDEDLTDSGYMRSAADRDNFVVLLSRNDDQCSKENCSMKLSRNKRLKDGVELQQENAFGTPLGFETLDDDFYCARSIGDCGAELPIYRWTRGKTDDNRVYAYTFDPSASISGYVRDAVPICYGWTDEGTVVPIVGGNSAIITGQPIDNTCKQLDSISQGKITYSSGDINDISVGTTATLQCDSNYVAFGQTSLVCTNNGWYPSTGLGNCTSNSKKPHLIVSGSSRASSTGTDCPLSASVSNGTIAILPAMNATSDPVAVIICNLGFVASSTETIKCSDGIWQLPNLDYPLCIQSSDAKCLPPLLPLGGHVKYSANGTNPFSVGGQAELICENNLEADGVTILKCTETGWNPPMFGSCRTRNRLKRQELFSFPCGPLFPLGGNVTYTQSNPSVLYSSGTSAVLICNAGTVLQGSATTSCSNGQWTPALGVCALSIDGGENSSTTANTVESQMTLGCGDMLPPLSGTVTYSMLPQTFGTRPSGTIATLTCNLGFTISGTTTSTCTNGIWSPPTLGSCNLGSIGGGTISSGSSGATCPDMLFPFNGMITYSSPSATFGTRPSGTIATLTCNLGFTVSGSLSSTCSNGIWSPATLGTCVEGAGLLGLSASNSSGSCNSPTITNGVATYSTGGELDTSRSSGTVATITCNAGFSLQGSPTSTCLAGSWFPAMPNCTTSTSAIGDGGIDNLQCFAMLAPLGGTLQYSTGGGTGPFRSGTTATLSCNNGVLPSGTTTAICEQGQWSPSLLGTCPAGSATPTCGTISVPVGGVVTYSSNTQVGPFSDGTIATLTCQLASLATGAASSICLTGQWQPSSLGTCGNGSVIGGTTNTSGSSCPFGVSGPLGSTITYSQGSGIGPYPSGTVASAMCAATSITSESSSLSNAVSTCSNGQWSPTVISSCLRNTGGRCTIIQPPTGGNVTYSLVTPTDNTVPENTIATLRCQNGTLTGNPTSTCNNGVWSPLIGSCGNSSTQSCSTAPITPIGSTVTYSNSDSVGPWPAGTSAMMKCPLNQYPLGNDLSVCENGTWQPTFAASCSLTSATNDGCIPFSSLMSSVNNGRAVYLPNPVDKVAIGTKAILVCDPSYSASGNTSVTCTSTGWSPSTLGSCVSQGSSVGVSCGAQFAPLNGIVTYSEGGLGPYPTGTVVRVTCNSGYSINGVSTSTCQNGLWIPSTLGQCVPSASGGSGSQCIFGIPSVPFGSIKYSSGTLGPYASGTTATLTCDSGYNPSGTTVSTCSGGIWTPSVLGTCNPSGGTTLKCQAIPFIFYGTVEYSKLGLPPYDEGTVATLVCNLGTVSSGLSSVTCHGGSWTPFPGLGSCNPSLARSPPKHLSAQASERTASENDITQTVGSSTEVTVIDDGASCPSPIAPPFGEITFSRISARNGTFGHGTTAALRCFIGYSIEGPSFSTCRRGMFRPMLGKCTNGHEAPLPGACLPLAAPEFAKITYIQSSQHVKLEIGTTAILNCSEAMRAVTGPATLVCTASGWEPAEGFGTCDDMGPSQLSEHDNSNIITAK